MGERVCFSGGKSLPLSSSEWEQSGPRIARKDCGRSVRDGDGPARAGKKGEKAGRVKEPVTKTVQRGAHGQPDLGR